MLEAAELPPTFGTDPRRVVAVIAGGRSAVFRAKEGAEDRFDEGARNAERVGQPDLVIGVSASSVTPFVRGAVEEARRRGATTVLVTASRSREIRSLAHVVVRLDVGPEVIAGSTRLKSGTAQKMVLNMLSTMTMVRLGYVTGNRMTNLMTRNSKLRQRALGIVMAECGMDEATAKSFLEIADWDLRVAIVMVKANATRELAEDALKKSGYAISRAVAYLLA